MKNGDSSKPHQDVRRLLQIADELRALTEVGEHEHADVLCLLDEAITLGAFAGVEHAEFRLWVRRDALWGAMSSIDPNKDKNGFSCLAMATIGRTEAWGAVYSFLADAVAAEADATTTWPELPEARSPWVQAITLRTERFDTIKKLKKFQQQHPEMFRNRGRFRLEIDAAQWAIYWKRQDEAAFMRDGEPPSLFDDPAAQDEAFAGTKRRHKQIHERKRRRYEQIHERKRRRYKQIHKRKRSGKQG